MRRDYNSTTRFRQKIWGGFPFTLVRLFREEGFASSQPTRMPNILVAARSRISDSREIAADRKRRLADLHSIRVFFRDASVPVVQRREQGFPKAKRRFLQGSLGVISCLQTYGDLILPN